MMVEKDRMNEFHRFDRSRLETLISVDNDVFFDDEYHLRCR